MSLLELQQAFQRQLLGAVEPIDPLLAANVPPQHRRGLPVYHHAYRATLKACLRDTYARTCRWMGNESFDTLADRFVTHHRSASWTLADYGRGFVRFLGTAFPDAPEIAELAWLERALRDAFAAGDRTPPQFQLEDIDWDRARLHFQPSVQVRVIQRDLSSLWARLGEEEEEAPRDFRVGAAAIGILVWRDNLSPRFRSTSPEEASVLVALLDGRTFAEACAGAGRIDIAEAGAWVAGWFRDQLITAVE